MPGERPFFIEGEITEVLIPYEIAYVKVDNGNVYHLKPSTPGINFYELKAGMNVRLEVTSLLTRVLSAKIIEVNMSEFIGQKINLAVREIEYNGKVYKTYQLDDPLMEAKIKKAFSDVRIFPPGTCGTGEYKPYRTNVYLDEDGTISVIDNG